MQIHRAKRNWPQYNQKLKNIARIDFFISEEAIANWHFSGKRTPGGKILYSDHVIEMCLLMRTFYKMAYRQTQGFVTSIFQRMNIDLPVPDYTTLARRAAKLKVQLRSVNTAHSSEGLILAVDSTGLSLYTHTQWNTLKHKQGQSLKHGRWRKLHVLIDVSSGEILESTYTSASANDGRELPGLLSSVKDKVKALCGDMAYDQVQCRQALFEREACQLIPPNRVARLARENHKHRRHREVLKERDEAIHYIRENSIDGDQSPARKAWKKVVGYHMRSCVESTMWQLKSHCTDSLSNKREDTRSTQARLKCKVVNMILAA